MTLAGSSSPVHPLLVTHAGSADAFPADTHTMLAAVSRVGPRTHPAASSFLALYSTITGLSRSWGTGSQTPNALVTTVSGDEDASSQPKISKRRAPPQPPTPSQFKAHRAAMKDAFPEGWAPPRKLSRAAMEGLRWLHAQDPETCTTPMLAEKFRISPEAVRRILKSKWEPSKEQRDRLLQRERVQRAKWITEKRKEEQDTQARMLRDRELRREHATTRAEQTTGGAVGQRRRRPRGINSNDKLSLT